MPTKHRLSSLAANHPESTFANTSNLFLEERPINGIEQLILKGSVDIEFFRGTEPVLLVAAIRQEDLPKVETKLKGGALTLACKGNTILPDGDGSIFVSGNNNVVVGGNYYGRRSANNQASIDKVWVGISLPEIREVTISGSGDITLFDLQQSSLHLNIKGSGDIKASGVVKQLLGAINGSGDIDAAGLLAIEADLSVKGSGDIRAQVSDSLVASIQGSGDIHVQGSPTSVSRSVKGSGDIRVR